MLDERTLGEEIPLSIGTAIAFEKTISVIDSNKRTDAIVFNLRTLWRNYYDSFKVENPSFRTIMPGFVEELAAIRSQCKAAQIASGVYVPDYNHLKLYLPKAIIKEPPPKRKHYMATEKAAMELMLRNARSLELASIKLKLPVINGRVWMMTHAPVDLLNRYQFRELMLLDSYTGNLKGPNEWMSKITKNPDYLRIPFNILTLITFGDGHYLQGYSLRYRKVLKELATQYNWTPLTTREKIIANLKTYPDQSIAKEFISMFNVSLE